MFGPFGTMAAMTTTPQTFCDRIQLTLTVGLFVACIANVALVCVWF
jgi:hypothetical protein